MFGSAVSLNTSTVLLNIPENPESTVTVISNGMEVLFEISPRSQSTSPSSNEHVEFEET